MHATHVHVHFKVYGADTKSQRVTAETYLQTTEIRRWNLLTWTKRQAPSNRPEHPRNHPEHPSNHTEIEKRLTCNQIFSVSVEAFSDLTF